jgi:hypothetical protein
VTAPTGDRAQELAILSHETAPDEITAALNAALLTDAELAEGEERWRELPDPFGDWRVEPCDDSRGNAGRAAGRGKMAGEREPTSAHSRTGRQCPRDRGRDLCGRIRA